jgi:cullin-associated NEDD8-dissociated protein 1
MVHQGIWDNVVVVTASDFGRTLSSNGLGTDHAWAGNYLVAGGSINGGQIFGNYPSDLSETGPHDLGRGRIIPTLPYDAMWHATAQWMDVDASKMADVIPHHVNFEPGSTLLTREQMFTN